MNLFEKIDLFEKMASQLSQNQKNTSDPEVFENTKESAVKDSIKSRSELLNSVLKR